MLKLKQLARIDVNLFRKNVQYFIQRVLGGLRGIGLYESFALALWGNSEMLRKYTESGDGVRRTSPDKLIPIFPMLWCRWSLLAPPRQSIGFEHVRVGLEIGKRYQGRQASPRQGDDGGCRLLFGEAGTFPILALPACKLIKASDSNTIYEVVTSAWNTLAAARVGPLWSWATDGDMMRRVSGYKQFLAQKLLPTSPIYGICTLLRSVQGIVLNNGRVINPAMLARYLTRLPDQTSESVHQMLFPHDPQEQPYPRIWPFYWKGWGGIISSDMSYASPRPSKFLEIRPCGAWEGIMHWIQCGTWIYDPITMIPEVVPFNSNRATIMEDAKWDAADGNVH
ncbi:hypothetical protein B0H14DRAFT_2624587 [Mycena olivaceomarginata]|nr:hypothetical protein B0H14DRAFT_2624587 [Mycena olivaceomarginata]